MSYVMINLCLLLSTYIGNNYVKNFNYKIIANNNNINLCLLLSTYIRRN